jgi:two-component system, response regulator PhcR
MSLTHTPREARTIMYVDDEPMACKGFARVFSEEFTVLTAESVKEALVQLNAHRDEIAIVMTDYAMPVSTGMDLLKAIKRDYKSVFCILTTAYAQLDMAIEAVNEAQVFKILPKPIDCVETRLVLREALALHSARVREKALHDNRAQAMRETLAFLAHEINTPLTTIRGYTAALLDWYRAPDSDTRATGMAFFAEHRPGVVLAAIEACERRALYCQSLVSTFVQSARDAYPGRTAPAATASSVVQTLLDEYPFESTERSWISCSITADFFLPGQRDLFYLALCTLTKNALYALQSTEKPCIQTTSSLMGTPACLGLVLSTTDQALRPRCWKNSPTNPSPRTKNPAATAWGSSFADA